MDLTRLARSVAEELTPHQPGARVEVGPLTIVAGDPILLRRLLTNLIGNGLKYVPAGRVPRVTVTAGSDTPGEAIVRVCDNGMGIPEGERSMVFEAFRRGSSGAHVPGSGLGLPICRRVVEGHGGRIWIDQPPADHGTCIAFTLPGQRAR